MDTTTEAAAIGAAISIAPIETPQTGIDARALNVQCLRGRFVIPLAHGIVNALVGIVIYCST
jgi:hypothetical protein